MDGGFIPEPEQEAERVTGNRNSDQNQFRSAPFQPPPSQEWGQQERGTGFGTGCSKCSSLSYSDEYFKAFNVFLCNQCRRGEKLISKSTAKQQYQLTDGDLSKLGSVKRSNPHRKDWNAMRLYLESQVKEIAFAKHGGAEGIEARARAILDAKLQSRLKKREEEKEKEAREASRLKRIRKKIETEAATDALAQAQLTVDEVEEI